MSTTTLARLALVLAVALVPAGCSELAPADLAAAGLDPAATPVHVDPPHEIVAEWGVKSTRRGEFYVVCEMPTPRGVNRRDVKLTAEVYNMTSPRAWSVGSACPPGPDLGER